MPRWTGHPDGSEIDIAVLPLTNLNGVKLMPYELPRPSDHYIISDAPAIAMMINNPTMATSEITPK